MLHDFQCKDCQCIFEEITNANDPNPLCIKCNGTTDKLFPLISATLKPATTAYNEAMMGNRCTQKFVDK